MGSLTEDLWEIILARLPLKSSTSYKLVCKQWKSIVESPFFRQCFLFHHQNSHSSWSLICRHSRKEVVAHYGCETWGLARSLGSYVSSFLTETFKTQKEKVRVLAYSDVGLILVGFKSSPVYYVANPISRQYVKIPPRPLRPLGQEEEKFSPGLATRIDEKNGLLRYKVVLMDRTNISTGVLSLLVYSSETGLWSYKTLDSHPMLNTVLYIEPITLDGNMYWFGYNVTFDYQPLAAVLVSHDLYAESDHQLRAIRYPDAGKTLIFSRSCTISQGDIMYTNIVSVNREYKLLTWRLKSWEWQLVSDISLGDTEYFPLGINPFDGNIIYMWNKKFASINLFKRQFRFHNNLERNSDSSTLSFAGEWDPKKDNLHILFTLRFVLPRWLHRIPSSPS